MDTRFSTFLFLVLLLAATEVTALGKPVPMVEGDFDGDGAIDRVQGFPEASDGAGRVDVYWGAAGFRVAWPTVLSPIENPSAEMDGGGFGKALAAGDFNGDGVDDLAIGAPDASFSASGLVRPPRASTGSVTVVYGCASPACDSVDADGAGLAAIGSSLDPSYNAGADRIQDTGDGWPEEWAKMGQSLAAGDFNGDGFDDLAIGVPGDTVNGVFAAGSVIVIHGSRTGLDQSTSQRLHQDLLPAGTSKAETWDRFATAVVAARIDDDRYDDLVVGVPYEDYGSFSDAGEINVFWGASSGLSAARYERFRHRSAMVGGNKNHDRLGIDVKQTGFPGMLSLGLQQAADCNGNPAVLTIHGTSIGASSPYAILSCEPDICTDSSARGDGALPAIPVNFLVIANAHSAKGYEDEIPSSSWTGNHPITGEPIAGSDYFHAMVDLLNQQVRSDEGGPVCFRDDCLRFEYSSHRFHSSDIFGGCDKLERLSTPSKKLTDNCDEAGSCPGSYTNLSDFVADAVQECSELIDDRALNVVIWDVCRRDPGPDGILGNRDDTKDCRGSGAVGGRGRTNDHVPYAFVDYERALKERAPSSKGFPWAAEEHEVGHAFGLKHLELCHRGDTYTMQTSVDECIEPDGSTSSDRVSNGRRNMGFGTVRHEGTSVLEVRTLIETAREHVMDWNCP